MNVTFTFEGRPITAVAGQSIAAALYAAGLRIFSRSFKYHRPRGLFCVSGDCPNCLMQVDGKPNVRTCIEPARDGQVVCRQNAWPSADFDVLRIFDKLDRFLSVGFYYKRFHKPRWLWPIFEHTVRHIAGLGRIDVNSVPKIEAEVEHLHTEVCVVGGGPSGLAAADAAARAGASVLMIDRQPRLGRHLLEEGFRVQGSGVRDGQQLLVNVQANWRVSVLLNTVVFGLYEGSLLGAFQGNRLLKIRAKQVIVCTGGRERPFVFHNNDLPGIMLGRGVLRLARLDGVVPGRHAVVLTDCDRGAELAAVLVELGIEVAAVVDARPDAAAADAAGCWQRFASSTVRAAVGRSRLRAVRIARLDAHSKPQPSDDTTIGCDLLCLASELAPANELLLQGGMRFRHKGRQWEPDRAVPGLWAAGASAGTMELDAQIKQGLCCGAEAAGALGFPSPDLEQLRSRWRTAQTGNEADERPPATRPQGSAFAPPSDGRNKRFVCLCEDVTEKDLEQAIAEGFDGIETLKRYSTANMGPCQGKMCGLLAAEVCARATGRDVNTVGTTTSRPPVVPVEMCVLAAAAHHPVRRTPLHHWHQAAGAKWMDAGQWKRPESYNDPIAEVQAVRNGVGLIDVSTLGKIEVVGPDAVELLERVYLNKWSDLKVGRARYGVMCNEDGIIFDDGVCARLAPDRFYLTATTGNAEGVWQWLELWRATWRLDATILNHTS
ncbi:MAG: (2Fe-2S)-binding protein, partial [Planctomycetes bacterium]|nr:(2Fe-2S)-binding protein [Planctomycetota bacterium]